MYMYIYIYIYIYIYVGGRPGSSLSAAAQRVSALLSMVVLSASAVFPFAVLPLRRFCRCARSDTLLPAFRFAMSANKSFQSIPFSVFRFRGPR